MIDSTLSIVVPVYNGIKYLDELVDRILKGTSGFCGSEILLVDDCSPDGSYERIKEIASVNPAVRGFLLDANYGQQNAVLCGLAHAKGDYAIIMDDDLENPPEAIPHLYTKIQQGFDAVYALNSNPGSKGIFRKAGSFLRDLTFRMITNIPKGIKVCSFRIISKELYSKVAIADTAFVYISMEMLKYSNNFGNIKVQYGGSRGSGHSFKKLLKLISGIYVNYSGSRFLKKFAKSGAPYKVLETTDGSTG